MTDPEGEPVPNAEVHVYVTNLADPLCVSIEGCVVPARLRGLTRADEDGRVVLVLPSPLELD